MEPIQTHTDAHTHCMHAHVRAHIFPMHRTHPRCVLSELKKKSGHFFPVLLMPENPSEAAGESTFTAQTLQSRFQLLEFYVLEILLE